jgi:Bacterial Ig-like domain (group 3)/FG-GAP-like repeat/Abnormal spindle-like microcephaly-assoc'd, ASPM-SPD-2-Hydin
MRPSRFIAAMFVVLAALLSASTAQTAGAAVRPSKGHDSVPPTTTYAALADSGVGKGEYPNATATRPEISHTSGLSFAPAVAYDSGGPGLVALAVADVNGDGKLDVLVTATLSTAPYGGVGVMLGNGDGTFPTAVEYGSGGEDAGSVAVGDVNGDGKLDLVVANQCVSDTSCDNSTVGVLLGNGDGTFQPAVAYNTGAWQAQSVAVADVNGDGKLDIIVAHNCATATSCANGVVSVLLGNGDGTFQPAVTYGSGGVDAYSVAIADVNGDGKPDLLVANFCITTCGGSSVDGSAGVLLGNGDGTFQTAVAYDSGGFWGVAIAVADFNGDGKLDLVVENSGPDNAGVLLGNGDGTFQTAKTYLTGQDETAALSIAVADVNGDGKPDLVATNLFDVDNESNGLVGVLLGNGDGTFQTVVSYQTGGYYAEWGVVADVNGDGKLDLVVGNRCQTEFSCTYSTISVLMNTAPTITTTSLVSSLNPSNFGESVTLTATAIPEGQGVPTGTVNFLDGSKSLGIVTLNGGGVATLTTTTLAVGTHSITAAYSGDANYTASTSPVLIQVVDGAIVKLSQSSINFGNQTVGIASSPASVTITNTGNVVLDISSVGISGTNGPDYGQTNNCGKSLAAGGTCTIAVTFTPSADGTRTASINVKDDAPGSPQAVSLTGTGVSPAVSFSATSLTFPTQVVYTTSGAQAVTLTNSGAGLLTVSKISASSQFSQTNTCGASVVAGGSCTITVKFAPTTINAISGLVSITDNAAGSPQTITLTGTGTYVQFTPASWNFGNQPIGTRSLPKRFTLSNKGHVTVDITSIAITGTDPGDFADTNTCGNKLAAGGSCFITVTFTPAANGARTADISVSDNGGGSPQTVVLSGSGTP